MVNTKFGSALWSGGLKSGGGQITTESGALRNVPYGFSTRFEHRHGTNPEELIGAAHAACFAMATAALLEGAGVDSVRVDARSAITLAEEDGGFTVTRADLTATVSGRGTEDALRKAANRARGNCPISRFLNTEVTLDLTVKPLNPA